jgi:hypothetical protein
MDQTICLFKILDYKLQKLFGASMNLHSIKSSFYGIKASFFLIFDSPHPIIKIGFLQDSIEIITLISQLHLKVPKGENALWFN